MRVNVNQEVRVELTTAGGYVYAEYLRNNPGIRAEEINSKNEVSLRMWELMSIFGPRMYTHEPFFVDNTFSVIPH